MIKSRRMLCPNKTSHFSCLSSWGSCSSTDGGEEETNQICIPERNPISQKEEHRAVKKVSKRYRLQNAKNRTSQRPTIYQQTLQAGPFIQKKPAPK